MRKPDILLLAQENLCQSMSTTPVEIYALSALRLIDRHLIRLGNILKSRDQARSD